MNENDRDLLMLNIIIKEKRTPSLTKNDLVQFHFTREILKMNGSAPNDGNINTYSILYVLHDVRKIFRIGLHHVSRKKIQIKKNLYMNIIFLEYTHATIKMCLVSW